jgi:Secretion system C-terminal sorting domain
MKKLLLSILTITAFGFGANAQIVNIPDAGLKQNLYNHGITITGSGIGIIDTNGDLEIQISEALAYTGKIQLGINPAVGYTDNTGLEAFVNATELHLQITGGTTLDLSQNNALTKIYVQYANISSLTLPQNTTALVDLSILTVQNPLNFDVTLYSNLTNLMIRYTTYSSLDLSNLINLQSLDLFQNQLSSLTLPVTTSLTSLDCSSNQLSNLNFLACPSLDFINCNGNLFTTLDFSSFQNLTSFGCALNNLLTNLNVANGNNSNFTFFSASLNPNLTCIEVDNTAYSISNWTNIDATASFSTNCSVGIDEKTGDINLSTYPNPTTSQLTLNTNKKIETITILDITGKTVKTIVSNNNTIDISGLTKGIYFLQVKTDKGIANSKFIKE